MTIDEFREEHSGSPIDLAEMAQLIVDHLEDNKQTEEVALVQAAQDYLDAKTFLERSMHRVKVELG